MFDREQLRYQCSVVLPYQLTPLNWRLYNRNVSPCAPSHYPHHWFSMQFYDGNISGSNIYITRPNVANKTVRDSFLLLLLFCFLNFFFFTQILSSTKGVGNLCIYVCYCYSCGSSDRWLAATRPNNYCQQPGGQRAAKAVMNKDVCVTIIIIVVIMRCIIAKKGLKIRSTIRYTEVGGRLWFYNEVVLAKGK